jgi:hypothetical protein
VGALGAEGGVVAVARVHPRLVGQAVEELGLHAVEQRGEPRGVLLGVADPAGEQAVAL